MRGSIRRDKRAKEGTASSLPRADGPEEGQPINLDSRDVRIFGLAKCERMVCRGGALQLAAQ